MPRSQTTVNQNTKHTNGGVLKIGLCETLRGETCCNVIRTTPFAYFIDDKPVFHVGAGSLTDKAVLEAEGEDESEDEVEGGELMGS